VGATRIDIGISIRQKTLFGIPSMYRCDDDDDDGDEYGNGDNHHYDTIWLGDNDDNET